MPRTPPTDRPVAKPTRPAKPDPPRTSHPRSPSLLASFRFAFSGLFHVLCTQRNARVHVVAAVGVVVAGAWFAITATEWLVLTLVIGLVFAAECFNTAIEALVDLVSPEWHEQAKVAKDAAAATVLCGAAAAVVVGAIVFLPRLVALFTPPAG